MKKGLMLCLGAAVLAVAVCGPARAETLRFGILPVLDTLPLQVAAQDGLFKAEGLDVELVSFQSALERDTAMMAGQIDGYFGDLIATLLLLDHGVDMRVALVSYRTTPGQTMFGIVTAPGTEATTLADVAGQSVGISATTIIEYLLDKMLLEQGQPLDLLERIEVKKVPIRLQMLSAGQLDLALLPEPLASLAVFQGGSQVATAEHLDMPLTVLCLSQLYFEGLGVTDYERFVSAYTEAVLRLRAHPDDYRGLMASTCRIPPQLVERFPVYDYPDAALPTKAEVDEVQAWMLEKGLIKAAVPYGRVVPAHTP